MVIHRSVVPVRPVRRTRARRLHPRRAGRFRAGTGLSAWLVAALCGCGSSTGVEGQDPGPDPEAPPAEALLVESFDDGDLAARGWFDNTRLTITTAEARSGSGSLAIRFPRGAKVPTFGGAARVSFPETPSVYVAFWVKYAPEWVGSGRTFHPHVLYMLTNQDDPWIGPSRTRLTAYIEHNYQGGIVPKLGIQDAANIDEARAGQNLVGVTESRAAAGCNGDADGYATTCFRVGQGWSNGKFWTADRARLTEGSGPTGKSAWHFVEVYLELNSVQGGVGWPDGVARYWLDGTLVIDRTGVLFRTGAHPAMAFRTLLVAPFIGPGSPVDQTMWIDELRVAARRP